MSLIKFKTDNNCNKPGHNHHTTATTYQPTRPATKPTFTTKKTTIYYPPSPTSRPPTTTKYPNTQPTPPSTYFTQRPTTTKPIYTTQRPIQTFPTRPSSTPNPTGSGTSGNLGVQPPITLATTPNPNGFLPGNHPPFFIIPYPFPIAPSCPCYAVQPTGNYSSQNQQQLQSQQQQQNQQQLQSQQQNQQQFELQQQQNQQNNQNAQLQWQSQNQYAIGYIPVLFVPHCSPGSHSHQVSGQYLQVPYPCSQCNQSNRNGRELDLNENYSSSDSFKQVLAQAGVDIFSNSLVKSPNRKRARKLKRVQKVEEPHMNELPETEQNLPKDEN